MASHKTVHGPIDPASPQGYTTFAVRVNPKAFFKSGITPADYRVPPFSMVFAKIPSEKDRGFDGSRVVHVSKKARRDPPVPDVICNFFDINNRADKTFTENSLRFIGISYDGIVISLLRIHAFVICFNLYYAAMFQVWPMHEAQKNSQTRLVDSRSLLVERSHSCATRKTSKTFTLAI